MTHHDDLSRTTRDGARLAANSFEQAVKTMQAMTAEMAETTRAQMEAHTQFLGDLSGARTIDRLVTVQTAYMRRLFEIVTAQNAHLQQIMGEAWASGTRNAQEAGEQAARMGRQAGEQAAKMTRAAGDQAAAMGRAADSPARAATTPPPRGADA